MGAGPPDRVTLSALVATRQAVFIQCGMACRRVRLCPARLMREYGDRPVQQLRFRCTCGGKGKLKGAGYQGWPVVEAELLSVPPYERALGG